MDNLSRFLEAQATAYDKALEEIRSGRKRSHWIWYIFPQLKGLGMSQTSEFYGIEDLEEAKAFLAHPVLGQRLREITTALAELHEYDPEKVVGYPDNLKVRSCMTLFHAADPDEKLFQLILDKYYDGQKDPVTLEKLHDRRIK